MKILSLLEAVKIINEMNYSELSAITGSLSRISTMKYKKPIIFSKHVIEDRFVTGDRTHVKAVDVFHTIKQGLEHTEFENAVKQKDESDLEVRISNKSNNLNIILSIKEDIILVVTGDYNENWENSKSYGEDLIITV
jgi:hypothetical protein